MNRINKERHKTSNKLEIDFNTKREGKIQIKCPVCGGESVHFRNIKNWGEQRSCLKCGLIFANPIKISEEPKKFFDKAYRGQLTKGRMQEFHKRVIKREQEERLNLPVILRCDKMEAIEWIKKNIPQGSYVLDIGCALGEVLDSLRDAGFNPIGIEPSITMVKRLRQRGHTVWHGTIDDIPQGSLPKISVCTAFIMLHHVPDPLGFFRAVKKLCPSSWFLISEGIYDWKCSPYPGPPRHYSVWNANSLSVVLNSGGYVVEKINTLDPVYKQPNIPFSERLLPIASSQRVVFFYRRVKFILFWPLFLWSTLRKKNKTRPFILAYAKTKK